jgi:hypothetical protein
MIPLVYILLAVFSVQRSAYALTAAVREAGRAYATASADGEGEARALRAAEVALADHGLDLRSAQPEFVCDQSPCLHPGGRITVRMQTRVPLPLFGSLAGGPASIGVDAEHVELVDRYRVVR